MQHKLLALACASALALPFAAHASASTLRFIGLSDIPAVLATTARDPAGWRDATGLRTLRYDEAVAENTPVVAWVHGATLSDANMRAQAAGALKAGLGVLVTHDDEAVRFDAATFGIEAQGRTVLYHRGNDGVLDMMTLGDDGSGFERAAKLWAPLQANRIRRDTSPRLGAFTAASEVNLEAVPHERFRHHAIGGAGNSVSHDILVLRDTTTTRDEKVVIVKAIVDITPAESGVRHRGAAAYRSDGEGDFLRLPQSYTVRTVVGWDDKDNDPGVRLDRAIPSDSPDVDRVVEQSSGVSTSYGLTTSSSVEDGLKGLGISAIGKVPVEFSASRTYADSTSVSMVTKSYYTTQTGEHLGKAYAAQWVFHLANDIAGDPGYFNSGSYKVGTKRMTPMMRKASTELLSVWRTPGKFEGVLTIGSSGSVDNRLYGYNQSLGVTRDPGSDTTPDGDQPYWWFWSGGKDPYASRRRVPAVPAQVIKLNLDSPYLTSSPTVLLQSSSGAGDCLTQVAGGPDTGQVAMAGCVAVENRRDQQWVLDKEGRYRNRASGLCLDFGGDGRVFTAPCGLHLTQRWRWAADRIVSHADGGTLHRLELRGGQPTAHFDAERHDPIVLNTDNALLPPWSNYPLKPGEGSTIPRFGAESPDVPASYHGFRAVSAAERWQTIPLRRSI
jgi:hemolysin